MAGNSKNALKPYQVFINADMSGDLTQAVPTNIQFLDNVAMFLTFTGTPTGAFIVEGGNDGTNWAALVFSTPPVASGAGNTILIDMNQLSFPLIRLRYVATSGSGSLTATIAGKAV